MQRRSSDSITMLHIFGNERAKMKAEFHFIIKFLAIYSWLGNGRQGANKVGAKCIWKLIQGDVNGII